ncbi:MAG: hypothetical protein QNK11_07950 [Legionella sp.]|nr:hypothetical protein [Legionella sp.]
MSSRAYIIGVGGFSKEVYYLLSNSYSKISKFSGFIDYKPKNNHIIIGDETLPIVDEEAFLSNLKNKKDVILFLGLGDPARINIIVDKFKGFEFPNLFADNVRIHNSVSFGKGNIITEGVRFTVDIEVGSYNVFNLNCTVGHDTKIGNGNVINPLVSVSGGVNIGNNNLIGTGASILQYLKIGNGNIVGGNGLLSTNVENNKIMVGVPCKELIKKK